MASIGLAAYSIRVNRRHETHSLQLDSFTQDRDLLAELIEYLRSRSGRLEIVQESQRAFSVLSLDNRDRSVSGVIQKGEFGSENPLVNVETGETEYIKTLNQADMIPFYYLVVIPNQTDLGILAFQTTGNFGIKGEFELDFREFFRERNPEFDVRMERLVTQEVIEQYLGGGRITKLRLVNLRVPSDPADVYSTGLSEEQVDTEFVVKANRGLSFDIRDRLREVINGRRDISQLVEIQDIQYEGVKVEVEIARGKYRTINLGNIDQFRTNFDLPDLDQGDDGHPVFAEIDRTAREIVSEILRSLNLDNHNV